MNRWLAEESKWCRTQALEATRKAEQLEDPVWVDRRLSEVVRSEAALYEAIAAYLALRDERTLLTDDQSRDAAITRHRRDAEHWERLAGEQSLRLAGNEDTALFGDGPA